MTEDEFDQSEYTYVTDISRNSGKVPPVQTHLILLISLGRFSLLTICNVDYTNIRV